MPRTTPRLVALLAAAAVAFVLVGCGASGGSDADDSSTTTAEAEGTTTTRAADTSETTEAASEDADGEGICAPLKVLSDYDAESAQLVDDGDWGAAQDYFVNSTDDVVAAYDDAIDLDTDLTDDLVILRRVTEKTAEFAAESSDISELSDKLLALPDIEEAGDAGLRLNTFAEEQCGFSTSGNG
jgi:hypothetical protein